ncbi:MAG: hypothetical protein Q8941_04905 [Bacteroidota bacterium]|nr:hypothetical protein [Bacteroidota bacterium]
MKTNSTILKVYGRKLAIFLLLAVTASAAFAISGAGKARNTDPAKRSSLLSAKTALTPGYFSLHSGYNFRGNHVINTTENKYITLNTLVTFQTGHTYYIVPLKKKAILNDKVVFNPNAATRR